jgi:hypothetical protein
MALRDHFHPPLFPTRPWESFHTRWADSIGDYLNGILPPRYVSDIYTHLGTQVAADVAEFEKPPEESEEPTNGPVGTEAVAVRTWSPPAATMVLPVVYPDDLEVRVTDREDDLRLVAVVGLVSPRNKDRRAARRAFSAKLAAYLQRGVGVVVADVVTSRHVNLHNDLAELLELDASFRIADAQPTYAVSYRPARREAVDQVDVWAHELALGGDLPVVPLALLGARAVPLDLNGTYEDACRRSRL